ncbi:hypothetical protein [Streptomyces sp. NPDC087294]|uniref:hypothetical protein n=1 Tax=Streptomyces sp. NPDC087294 TaxID=3365777 RepID=UPI0037F87494
MLSLNSPSGEPVPRQVEPGEAPVWADALALVERDLAVTLPEHRGLQLLAVPAWEEGEPEQVYVALASGTWWGNPLSLDPDASPDDALGTVAAAAQDTVSERLWQAWPVCATHHLGMHLTQEESRPAWWCGGGLKEPGHVRCLVGELGTVRQLPG